MSSPITSVPDPADAASTSADPLAGVITQVSPRQASAPVRGGPARPTKVAKQGAAKAAIAEKKKKKVASTPDEEEAVKSEAKASLEGEDGGKAALATETSTSEGNPSTSHSQNPSSTLVGTTTTHTGTLAIDDSIEGLSKDKPVDASATPTEPDPTVANSNPATTNGATQDMTQAAETLSKKETPSIDGTSNIKPEKERIEMQEKSKPIKGENVATTLPTAPVEKPKKPSFTDKLIAFLTCSSATSSMVAAENHTEEKAVAGSKKVSQTPLAKTTKSDGKKNSRSKLLPPSQRGSFDRSTPNAATGGGTRLPKEETGDVMSGAVVPPGSSFAVQDRKGNAAALGAGAVVGGVAAHKFVDENDDDDEHRGEEDDEEWVGDDQLPEDDDQTEEQRLIMQGGAGIPRDEAGNLQPLLVPVGTEDTGRKCLVLDLDETLVHSSFKMISNADFVVPVEIEGTVHNVYVIKRPGVDEFMRKMGEIYEVVVFTASLSKYADPVLDILDIHHVVRHRLFRESCYNHRGNYVKDLSQLGREIETAIIIDNSPASYIFHPNNAVPISSWFNDPHDTELTDLCPFLAELADVDDVRAVLDGGL
ncbi:hypothetical protein CBS101457_004247 [Exobasidium rhododendri]|nr:hypothetical protein CBS101457_004247 [Exobasidium rhododendri]